MKKMNLVIKSCDNPLVDEAESEPIISYQN